MVPVARRCEIGWPMPSTSLKYTEIGLAGGAILGEWAESLVTKKEAMPLLQILIEALRVGYDGVHLLNSHQGILDLRNELHATAKINAINMLVVDSIGFIAACKNWVVSKRGDAINNDINDVNNEQLLLDTSTSQIIDMICSTILPSIRTVALAGLSGLAFIENNANKIKIRFGLETALLITGLTKRILYEKNMSYEQLIYIAAACWGVYCTVHQLVKNNSDLQLELADRRYLLQCATCYNEVDENMMVLPLCGVSGHTICRDCIRDQVTDRIRHRGVNSLSTMTCPAVGCTHILGAEDIQMIAAGDATIFNAWETAITDEALNPAAIVQPGADVLRRCPSPGCNNAYFINITNAIMRYRCAACNNTYCSHCGLDHQTSVTCDAHRATIVPRAAEPTTADILRVAGARECPGCRAAVARNGGCIHMTCRCTYEFCFLCGQRWDNDHRNWRPGAIVAAAGDVYACPNR